MKETKCSNFTDSILILLFSWFGRGAALPYISLWRVASGNVVAIASNGWNKLPHLLRG